MKDETFAVLANFDSYFYTATQANFIRGLTTTEINSLIGAAKEVGILYTNNHCPKCTLDFIKKLAVPYFKEKTTRIEAAKVKEEQPKKEKAVIKPKQKGKNYDRQSQEERGEQQSPDETRSET